MARVSFSLRRDVADQGSYVRYDDAEFGVRADSDGTLRADGYQLPPGEFPDNFFQAVPVGYGAVQIDWGITYYEISGSTAVTEVIVMYSDVGEPQTVSSGSEIVRTSTDFEYFHEYNHLSKDRPPEPGKWAYYSLFAHYASTAGDDYYERLASLSVLVPKDYGSTMFLYKRIPAYYRDLDEAQATYVNPESQAALRDYGTIPLNGRIGPLFRFLSVAGYDMDKVRTLIDYLMIGRDPALAETETLDAIAEQVGVPLRTSDLGASRLRSLLDEIGVLRRTKGTLDSLITIGRAISGSDVEFDEDNLSLKFYSQRVNYITDPLDLTGGFTHRPAHEVEDYAIRTSNSQGSYDPSTYVAGASATYPTPTSGDSYQTGMYWTASASAGGFNGFPVAVGDLIVAYGAPSGTPMDADEVQFGVNPVDVSATTYDSYTPYTMPSASDPNFLRGTSADGVDRLLVHLTDPIPVKRGDNVGISVHDTIGTSYAVWARLVDVDGNIVGWSSLQTRADNFPAYQVPAVNNVVDDDWTVVFVELLVDISSTEQYRMRNVLAERNFIGKYFDGNTSIGGWLIDDLSSTSDYRWSSEGENNGNAYQSISIYTEQFRRTRGILKELFFSFLPLSEDYRYRDGTGEPNITAYDAIPGQSAIDAYLTP